EDHISPGGTDASDPVPTMDASGNVVVVWEQSDGSDNQIFGAEYRGGWWSYPSGLSSAISPSDSIALSPVPAKLGSSYAAITWQQSDGSKYQIFKSEYRNGYWIHPSGLSDNLSPDGTNANAPRIAVDNNSNAVIAWEQWDGSHWQVYRAVGQGGYWTLPSSVTEKISPSGQNTDDTTLAMDSNGDTIIAWKQFDGNDWQIYMSERRGGIWSQPSDLPDAISPAGEDADDPVVVMSDSGRAAIVWEQYDGSHWQIFKSEYSGGVWTHPADLSDNISLGDSDALGIGVAMNRYGHMVIAWEQDVGAYSQIFKAEFRGVVWAQPVSLSESISPAGSDARGPAVAMDDYGTTIIAWEQSDGSDDQIFISEYRNGVWTHPTGLSDAISPSGQTVSFTGLLAMDADSSAVVAWTQSNGSHDQLFISHYSGGGWSHPADLTSSISPKGQSVNHPALAMNREGKIIIVWEQLDGSNTQIYKSEYR
ncbi:MAG: hypothetical protein ABIK28_24310, partial [Planctomycetota bacterium]